MDISWLAGLLILLLSIWFCAHFRLQAKIWSVLLGGVYLILVLAGTLPHFIAFLFFIFFVPTVVFSLNGNLRRQYLLQPFLPYISKQIPKISQTEQEAIDAGDTWWEKELFSGSPQWSKLYHFPKATLTPDEANFIDDQVETLCGLLDDWRMMFQDHDLPQQAWHYLKEQKFFGMVIPKEYGGLGFSAFAHSTVISKIATKSISAAVTAMVPNSLGPGELLLRYGTEEQKNFYLPRLASGEEIPCFGLTSTFAGSDAGSITDRGTICTIGKNGKTTLGIRLTWEKRYITLAPVATVVGLAVRLYDPEHLLGEKEDIGITVCLVPAEAKGVEIGRRHDPLHLAFMNGPIRGKDVLVPIDAIIGGVAQAGKGWRMLMECLSVGRSISLPSLATASGKLITRYTGAYAQIRQQFGTSLASFEGIQEPLGFISGFTYLLEAARSMTASAVDQDINPSTVSAIVKYHLTEIARQVTMHAMDIHAGHAIQLGPRNILANIYISLPMSITVEGANILTRNLIIFGQGAIRCHPYILQEVNELKSKEFSLARFDKILFSHIGFIVSNGIRSFAYGITGGLLIKTHSSNVLVRKYEKQLSRMSAALAFVSDIALVRYGQRLKKMERLSARLGDVLSHLYLASCVLKRFVDAGFLTQEQDHVAWCLDYCLYQIQKAIRTTLTNFPNKWMGRLALFVIFPYGASYCMPPDQLHGRVAIKAAADLDVRARLTPYSFEGKSEQDMPALLENALTMSDKIMVIEQKIQQAIKRKLMPANLTQEEERKAALQAGAINAQEDEQLASYQALVDEIVKVSEFSFQLDELLT